MVVMTLKHKKRLGLVLVLVIGIGTATALALTAFRQNMLYYFTPSEINEGKGLANRMIRVGGLVMQGSVQRASNSLLVHFKITDRTQTLAVQYTGILPDLFRENQGVVAIGKIQADGTFKATEVLAKHDENYMPPEVADSLKTTKAEYNSAAQ